jgi:hypothetical protein
MGRRSTLFRFLVTGPSGNLFNKIADRVFIGKASPDQKGANGQSQGLPGSRCLWPVP